MRMMHEHIKLEQMILPYINRVLIACHVRQYASCMTRPAGVFLMSHLVSMLHTKFSTFRGTRTRKKEVETRKRGTSENEKWKGKKGVHEDSCALWHKRKVIYNADRPAGSWTRKKQNKIESELKQVQLRIQTSKVWEALGRFRDQSQADRKTSRL
jgi:hypothetical protein